MQAKLEVGELDAFQAAAGLEVDRLSREESAYRIALSRFSAMTERKEEVKEEEKVEEDVASMIAPSEIAPVPPGASREEEEDEGEAEARELLEALSTPRARPPPLSLPPAVPTAPPPPPPLSVSQAYSTQMLPAAHDPLAQVVSEIKQGRVTLKPVKGWKRAVNGNKSSACVPLFFLCLI